MPAEPFSPATRDSVITDGFESAQQYQETHRQEWEEDLREAEEWERIQASIIDPSE